MSVTDRNCTCCGERITASEWPRLPLVGVMDLGPQTKLLELRNHHCNSTLAIELTREPEVHHA